MVKYFDYLDTYESDFNKKIATGSLKEDIRVAREMLLQAPRFSCMEARRIAELILREWLKKEELDIPISAGFSQLIESAFDRKLISASIRKKLDIIRRNGNQSAHGKLTLDVGEAQNSIVKLDEFLRYYANKEIDAALIPTVSIKDDVLLSKSTEILQEIEEKAATEKENKDILECLKNANQIEQERLSDANQPMEMLNLFQQLDALKDQFDDIESLMAPMKEEGIKKIEAAQNAAEAKTVILEKYIDKDKKCIEELQELNERIDKILAESDWISKLLDGTGKATKSQLHAIKNDRGIVQIKGAAGSGKTLCLLAKALQFVSGKELGTPQQNLVLKQQATALIVSFNKTLRANLERIVANLPESQNISVESFDAYVNRLARSKGLRGSISYGKERKDLIVKAIDKLGKTTVDSRFYNNLDSERINFLEEEFSWLEAMESIDKAKYQTMERTGRGRKYSLGRNSHDREAIWTLYEEFRTLFKAERKYAIYDAVKFLLERDDLPQYDYIAVDEVQDLSLISIKLLMKLLKEKGSTHRNPQFVLVGDENQKLFKRDFKWKDLGTRITRANTETLEYNLRNTEEIARFSSKLINDDTPSDTKYAKCDPDSVKISQRTLTDIQRDIQKLYHQGSTLIVFQNIWGSEVKEFKRFLNTFEIPYEMVTGSNDNFKGIESQKVYLSNYYNIKGLEFDHVIIAQFNHDENYSEDVGENEVAYVAFSRARNLLCIHYQNQPHQILKEYFADYLEK